MSRCRFKDALLLFDKKCLKKYKASTSSLQTLYFTSEKENGRYCLVHPLKSYRAILALRHQGYMSRNIFKDALLGSSLMRNVKKIQILYFFTLNIYILLLKRKIATTAHTQCKVEEFSCQNLPIYLADSFRKTAIGMFQNFTVYLCSFKVFTSSCENFKRTRPVSLL